ncbi:uncharacterized protein PGTG_22464 [Puccinia graminis f. sp. tritici CRL 75-36-700-3]|uniref:Uncharacterized protein n=1 Tax=Puccinia graminis f. sp. tritici (strain CRL 75-36-700-3 / race SCCL) TaxID=418459 RepID=H6QUR4_PUCGT|nr:uncharacterized protein PGTG_22464 [Puccinia graminis f. sp. tritici CRL 75-36-700-3]EHS64822.1 hypothetical protein PGTG_22464 [Puccinia graminis f. sp. tritici CRL 75-36-700-3]
MQVLSAVVLLAVVCNYASAWSFPCNKEAGLTEGVCQMNPPAFGTDPKVQKFGRKNAKRRYFKLSRRTKTPHKLGCPNLQRGPKQ